MIGNSDRLVTPFVRRLDDIVRLGRRVHRGHTGMQMQFHALFGSLVLARNYGHL